MYTPQSVEEKEYLEKYDANKYPKPCVTVDIVVKCNDDILLITRKNFPYKGCLAFPGGFLDVGKEDTLHAAIRELYEETNLNLYESDLKILGVYSNPDRDPRDHVVSIVYYTTIVEEQKATVQAKDDAASLNFYNYHKLLKDNNMAFDHYAILKDFVKITGCTE